MFRWPVRLILAIAVFSTNSALAEDWLLPFLGRQRPVLDMDFRSMASLPTAITYTRAGTVYDWSCSPTGQLQAFTANVPLLPICNRNGQPLGWGIWAVSSFMQMTWGRDLTQATWVKSNATVALDQTGADGTANAASSFLATANNATVIGSGGAGTSQFPYELTAFIKCLICTGAVSISGNSGVSWTNITTQLSSSYSRAPYPQGLYTVTKAQKIGFKLANSGDKIAIDLINNEQDLNSTFIAPGPAIVVAGSTNLTRAADVATMAISAVPGMNPDSFTVVTTTLVPRQWRGMGFASAGYRGTILQIDEGGATPLNALNLNYQADGINGSSNCKQDAGVTPSCPDVNLDSKVANVNATKVRCTTAGGGLATIVAPYNNVFFTTAASYDITGGIRIICNSGYGSGSIIENSAAAPGFSSGQLNTIRFGVGPNFSNSLNGPLTIVTIYSPALTGQNLVQAMQRQRQRTPTSSRSYIALNGGGSLIYNGGGGTLIPNQGP